MILNRHPQEHPSYKGGLGFLFCGKKTVHPGPTDRTQSLQGWFAVFHGHALWIFDFALFFALDAVGDICQIVHLLSLSLIKRTYKTMVSRILRSGMIVQIPKSTPG